MRRILTFSQRLRWITAGAVLVTAVVSAPTPAAAAPGCTGLAGLAIPASVIGEPTRGGRVESAAPATKDTNGTTVGYCAVRAVLHPIDRSAPDITLQIGMPARWNHRTLMFGGGGYDGTVPDVTQNVPFGRPDQPTPLARGYATYGSDSGHRAGPTGSLDGSFGVNDEALRNFAAGDALKKTHDAARYLVRRAYGAAPGRAFFAGGSTGGREALVVAQRWPDAFDGVISAYPAWNNAAEILFLGHLARVMSRPGAFPGPKQQALLHRRVLAACDGLDGVEDGIVSNERGCRFDPRVLRCPGEPDCLSDAQIAAVTAASTSFRWPYRIASGERHYPGFPLLSGADMRTPYLGFGTSAPADPMPATSAYGFQFWDQWVKYFLTRDPQQNSLAIDPARPGKWQSRISYLSTVQDRNDADLRPFARSGGRLLMLHGAADELVSHRSTNDYYERVLDTAGRRTTDQFLRYYLVPGANHANVGAPAFAAGWDSLTALERWVENGRAPVDPVTADTRDGRTRPLCEYPRWPRYRSGDPARAQSFACVR
ncbi:tannase/feruloyl esterase family alpha/beta hydrolase [Cryptosporangium japonicum]|uniref:Tannase/feruloyl esterase family alpha/beta hydrolase n=1 Tax=Cryptosporangium japonicum TaxID=80872 RepID=A0ABP3DVF7_9ACTN